MYACVWKWKRQKGKKNAGIVQIIYAIWSLCWLAAPHKLKTKKKHKERDTEREIEKLLPYIYKILYICILYMCVQIKWNVLIYMLTVYPLYRFMFTPLVLIRLSLCACCCCFFLQFFVLYWFWPKPNKLNNMNERSEKKCDRNTRQTDTHKRYTILLHGYYFRFSRSKHRFYRNTILFVVIFPLPLPRSRYDWFTSYRLKSKKKRESIEHIVKYQLYSYE